MKKPRLFSIPAIGLVCSMLLCIVNVPPLSAQQSDPFYKNLLERAQKSFLASSYEEAARDFEVAAFGLTGDKNLRAKAYTYLSLCKYYMKDIQSSEKSLREAAALMGKEGFAKLEIYESAWPDLDKLMTFYNIIQTGTEPLPKEVEKPKPGNPETPNPKPKEPPGKPEEKSGTASEPPAAQGSATPQTAQNVPDPQKSAIKLDEIKEGDILPLDLVETLPVAIKRVAAIYPSYGGASLIEGTVMINGLISENGDVVQTEIIKGIKGAFGFDQAALRAVRQWKFEPASIKGIKVKVWISIAIEFKKESAQ
jgi:protein TonB